MDQSIIFHRESHKVHTTVILHEVTHTQGITQNAKPPNKGHGMTNLPKHSESASFTDRKQSLV